MVQKLDKKRDKSLISDYLKKDKQGKPKYTITELGLKYARKEGDKTIPLSTTRIHQVLNRYGVKKDRVKTAE